MFQIFQPYDLRLSVPFWSRACTPVASTAAHKLSNGLCSETFEGAKINKLNTANTRQSQAGYIGKRKCWGVNEG